MNLRDAKICLDKVIRKGRVHLYKPIQVAEILHRDRIVGDVDLSNVETYRTQSRRWRDPVCVRLIGKTSTSSARYQEDLFNDNATPPRALAALGAENKRKGGVVEAYIYQRLRSKFSTMSAALSYCLDATRNNFDLRRFLEFFRREPGLKRSVDKIYEIVVYALFDVLVDELNVEIQVSADSRKLDLLREFEDFAKSVICIDPSNLNFRTKARLYRVGVTNAADRGLDMWGNFGPAVQIKHLSLSEELAENIVGSIAADRIVIVCKDAERGTIVSLLTQIGWKARIQSIITESDLLRWYEKALRGTYGRLIGDNLLRILREEIQREFPSSSSENFLGFYKERGYNRLASDPFWKAE